MTIKEVLEQKNPVLIDVRTPVEFQGGSVENAVNIPMNEVVDRFDEFQKSQPIIVFHENEKAKKNLQYALPKILEYYSKLGYTFEAIPKR